MIRFDITPPLDNVEGGDVLKGDVVVEVETTTQCSRLDLALQCVVRLDTRKVHTLSQGSLFEGGTWEPGKTYRYPFEVSVPNGPFSAEKGPWQVIWRLHTEAEIQTRAEPWTRDHPFTMVPASPATELAYNPGVMQPVTTWQPHVAQSWLTRELSWVLAMFGGLSVWFELRSGQGDFPYIGFVVLALAMSLVIAGRRDRRRQQQATLPIDITLTLDPPDPAPGDTLDLEASLHCKTPIQLDNVSLSLLAIGQEGGARHTLHQHSATLLDTAQAYDADATDTFTTTLSIPPRAAHTLEVGEHAVRWYVELSVDADGREPWLRRVECIVAPPPPELPS